MRIIIRWLLQKPPDWNPSNSSWRGYIEDTLLGVNTKVIKRAKIRNRYNQAPHLTQDTKHVSPIFYSLPRAVFSSNSPAIEHESVWWGWISRCFKKVYFISNHNIICNLNKIHWWQAVLIDKMIWKSYKFKRWFSRALQNDWKFLLVHVFCRPKVRFNDAPILSL